MEIQLSVELNPFMNLKLKVITYLKADIEIDIKADLKLIGSKLKIELKMKLTMWQYGKLKMKLKKMLQL